MHHNELWQLFSPNGEPIPGVGRESAIGNPDGKDADIIGVAIVFLYRVNQNGEVEFLWQKRSDEVDRYPGDYDLSAGGHINLGESPIEAAIREGREEIGVQLTKDDLEYGFMQPFNKNRFAWLYFVNWTGRTEDFQFNDEEVSGVKWVLNKEMPEFVKNFAKPPLVKDRVAFVLIDEWLRMHDLA
jgi:8-oxo-dGTP pyrophosphatase MutT (NUDIX family)